MPNWCNNRLQVLGPKEDIARFKQQATGHSPWLTAEDMANTPASEFNFHSLLQVPEEIVRSGKAAAGEEWQRAHWGTKWEGDNVELVDHWETQLIYGFDTAWSPPIELLQTIGPQWPTLTFLLDYEELGMGFKGITKIQDTENEDHCISL